MSDNSLKVLINSKKEVTPLLINRLEYLEEMLSFTEKHKFLEKAYQTYKIAKNNIYVLFPIEFITTKRFHDIAKNVGGKIYIPSGRINFESGLGKKSKSPAFGSVVMKIQDNWEIELIDKEMFK